MGTEESGDGGRWESKEEGCSLHGKQETVRQEHNRIPETYFLQVGHSFAKVPASPKTAPKVVIKDKGHEPVKDTSYSNHNVYSLCCVKFEVAQIPNAPSITYFPIALIRHHE